MSAEPSHPPDREDPPRSANAVASEARRDGARPRLLIVSALFTPSRRIGAQRPARIAAHLSTLGWDVSVLTLHPRDMEPIDSGGAVSKGVRVYRTAAPRPVESLRRAGRALRRLFTRGPSPVDERLTPPRMGDSSISADESPRHRTGPGAGSDRSGSVGALRTWLSRRMASLEFPDRWIGWIPFALLGVRGRTFDVVLATLPPYTPVLIARILARRTGARLVLDYRDPWTEAPRRDWGEGWHEGLRERHRRLEDACLAAADLVVGVSPTICRMLSARTGREAILVPNSYEPATGLRETPGRAGAQGGLGAPGRAEEAAGAEAPTRRRTACGESSPTSGGVEEPRDRPARLVYAGSLAYGRSLEPLLAAMASLRGEAGPDRLRLVYAGPHGHRIRRLAELHGMEASVEDSGSLEGARVLELLRGAAAAIVVVSRDYEYQYPGKIFEIVAAGRPILLIAAAGSDASELLHRHRLGWCHEPEDIEGIARSLRMAISGEAPRPIDLELLQTGHVLARLDGALRRLLC